MWRGGDCTKIRSSECIVRGTSTVANLVVDSRMHAGLVLSTLADIRRFCFVCNTPVFRALLILHSCARRYQLDETDPSYDDPTMEDCGYEILSKVRPVPAKPAAAAALAAAPTTATAAAAASGILYVCVHAA